jgi:hypothetical protein
MLKRFTGNYETRCPVASREFEAETATQKLGYFPKIYRWHSSGNGRCCSRLGHPKCRPNHPLPGLKKHQLIIDKFLVSELGGNLCPQIWTMRKGGQKWNCGNAAERFRRQELQKSASYFEESSS